MQKVSKEYMTAMRCMTLILEQRVGVIGNRRFRGMK